MARLRLFIAIETPQHVRHQLISLQRQLQQSNADVRWEPAEKLHATLKFLGDTEESLIPSLAGALRAIACSRVPFEIKYSSVGCFPSLREPRVVWVGIDDQTGVLTSLYLKIEDTVTAFGFEKEHRAFHPHLTLGRVKGHRHLDRLIALLKTVTFESQPVVVSGFIVVKSQLQPSGSVYTVLESFPLTGPSY